MQFYQTLISALCMLASVTAFSQEEGYYVTSGSEYGNVEVEQLSSYFVFTEKGKVGVKSEKDQSVVLPASYSFISIDRKTDLILVYNENKKAGLFDPQKDTFYFPVEYQSIELDNRTYGYGNGFQYRQKITLKKNETEQELVILQDDIIATHIREIHSIHFVSKDLSILVKGSKQGIFSVQSGSLILPVSYDSISPIPNRYSKNLEENNLFIVRKGSKHGVFSSKEQLLVPEIYDSVSIAGNSFIGWLPKKIAVYQNEKKVWERIRPTDLRNNNYAFAFKDKKGKWELLRMDQLALAPKTSFDSVELNEPELFDMSALFKALSPPIFAYKDHDLYLINAQDTLRSVIIEQGSVVSFLKDDFLLISSKEKRGVYSYKPEEMVPVKFDQVMPWYGKTKYQKYWACKDGKSWYFYEGKTAFDSIQADSVRLFSVHAFCAVKNGKIALINRNEQVTTDFIYDFVELNTKKSDKLARIDTTYYYLSEKGKTYPTTIRYSKKGYTSLEEISDAFIKAITSPDDDLIYEFADKITPDYHSYEYLNSRFADYRGTFKDFSEAERHKIFLKYYDKLGTIKRRLASVSNGKPIENKGFENPKLRNAQITKQLVLQGTESKIILSFGDEENDSSISLGELLLVDGYFKAFSTPRF